MLSTQHEYRSGARCCTAVCTTWLDSSMNQRQMAPPENAGPNPPPLLGLLFRLRDGFAQTWLCGLWWSAVSPKCRGEF